MPQYRIEVSPNNRATCKDTVCKHEGIKITKGEIRFATWVEIKEHGSWSYKHWGCVSGFQLGSVQEDCDQGNGKWDFDAIDGYDEIEDEDIKEKIRRCVIQGHIDPEDFNGDPEKNVPGQKGIHLTEKQKAAKAAQEDDSPKKTKAKRSRKDDEDEEEPAPKKSKTKTKAVKAEAEDEEDVKPKKATKSKKVKAEVETDEEKVDLKPKKSKVKAEDDVPTKKSKIKAEDDMPTKKPGKGSKKAAVDGSKPTRGRPRKSA